MKKLFLFVLLTVGLGANCWASDPVARPVLAAFSLTPEELRLGSVLIDGGASTTLLEFVKGAVESGGSRLGTPVGDIRFIVSSYVRSFIREDLVFLGVEPKICLSVRDTVKSKPVKYYVFWEEKNERFFVFNDDGQYLGSEFCFESRAIKIEKWFQPKTILEQMDILFNSREATCPTTCPTITGALGMKGFLMSELFGGYSFCSIADEKFVGSAYELFEKNLVHSQTQSLKIMIEFLRESSCIPDWCFVLDIGLSEKYYVFGRSADILLTDKEERFFVFSCFGQPLRDKSFPSDWPGKVVAWTRRGGMTIMEQLASVPDSFYLAKKDFSFSDTLFCLLKR